MRVEWTDELVIKVAESESDRYRLAREASVLQAMAHPAIVRLVSAETAPGVGEVARMCLQRVRGVSLADAPPQPVEVVAGWGAAVATVVADLHDLGFIHRAIAPEHILIDEHGRPILCGFGRAEQVREERDEQRLEDDVRAVAALVEALVPHGHDSLRRLTRRWTAGRRRHQGDARALARALVDQVPDARVAPARPGGEHGPGESERGARAADPASPGGWPAEHGGSRSGPASAVAKHRLVHAPAGVEALRRRAVAIALGAGLIVGSAAGAGAWSVFGSSGGARVSPGTPRFSYLVRSGPGEHPITVVGRWGCGPALPAVLDSRSGSIWTFPDWPSAGTTVTARLLRQVAGASGLAAVSDGPGCDRLLVLRTGHPDMTISVGGGG